MSYPISYCQIVKAVDDPEYFPKFHEIMQYDIKHGSFTQVSCEHDPPCRELTDEECEDLNRRIREPLKETSDGT